MSIKSGVFLLTKGKRAKNVLKGINNLPDRRVLVGIPEDKTDRDDSHDVAYITNAVLGYIHENGAPEANIPARPFLVPGIREARTQITSYLAQAGQAVLAGDSGKADRAMHAAGLVAQASVRNKIQTGPFLPLAPGTLAARRARGRTGTKPLLDTAQMRNAITYVIRNKGPV